MAKIEVLEYVAENPPCTSLDLAVARKRTVTCSSTQLGRFYRWGLLERFKIQGKLFYYRITQKGLERLTFLKKIRKLAQAEDWLKNIKRCPVKKLNRHTVPYIAQPDQAISETQNIMDNFTPEVMEAISYIFKNNTFYSSIS